MPLLQTTKTSDRLRIGTLFALFATVWSHACGGATSRGSHGEEGDSGSAGERSEAGEGGSEAESGAGGAGDVPPSAGTGGIAGQGGQSPVGGAGGMSQGGSPTSVCEDADVDCVNGRAGTYACSRVDLLSSLANAEMQGGDGVDVWGWTDSATGEEYALVGLTNGTAFVDISEPCQPLHLGHLRTQTVNSVWRDIKTYRDHAYVVAESQAHGMQVFDLRQLRNLTDPPVNFQATTVVDTFGSAHNLVINEESGFAYALLSDNCKSPRSFDLSDPAEPLDLGCWFLPEEFPIHELQCVNYKGPDSTYTGREICVGGGEGSGLVIVDVTNKANVALLSTTPYEDLSYATQGSLTDDHRYFLLTDENDELKHGINTTVYIFDVTNLASPVFSSKWVSDLSATDHTVYVRGNYAFLSAYSSGLRILDLTNIDQKQVTEAGYFDTFDAHNDAGYSGIRNIYAFYPSGVVVTSGTALHVLYPDTAGRHSRRRRRLEEAPSALDSPRSTTPFGASGSSATSSPSRVPFDIRGPPPWMRRLDCDREL